ncbi:MAG TPA: DUF3617 family protein [Candidatus Acidoferrum sp.]|nr:DUF3617 family protein [Candidatus Acidoferrum sp.]
MRAQQNKEAYTGKTMEKMLAAMAAAFLLPIGIASAAGPPEQKEGLWSFHRQSIDNPGNQKTESSSTICRSRAYDAYTLSLVKNKKLGCTTLKEDWQGSIYSVESHCIVAGTAVDSKGTVTYAGDTSAHSETRATYTPALGGVSETTMIMDQKYVGSCPAGAQPGDLTNAEGRVTHLWKH